MLISNAYAQAPAATGGGDILSQMLPLILMFVVLYFLMIRPQMKKAKEHRAMLEAVKKGDEVMTSGGLLGKVSKVSEAYVTLEIAETNGNAVEVTIQKTAVQALLPTGTLKSI